MEFQRLFLQKQYEDGDTVTEDKLSFFLADTVANRPFRGTSMRAE